MIKDIDAYFEEHGLYDGAKLAAHCEANLVRMSRSARVPNLALLHYSDRAVFERQWSPFALSCRGLIVDLKHRRLAAVPFFKFFNLGESSAPSAAELQALGAFEATEKLDGSMGIAFHDADSGRFLITTKGSFDSEHGEWASGLFPDSLKDASLLASHTVMFEIISGRFRIVVDYAAKGYAEGLYLLGVRERATQRLFDRSENEAFARKHGLKITRSFAFSSIEAAVDETKGLPHSEEGYVLRFAGDVMVKLKSPEYLRVHRFLSNLSEKSLLELLAKGQEKQILDHLPSIAEEYRDQVTAALKRMHEEAAAFRAACAAHFAAAPKGDRKTFAQWAMTVPPKEYTGFLFKTLDGKPPSEADVHQYFLNTGRYAPSEGAGFTKLQDES